MHGDWVLSDLTDVTLQHCSTAVKAGVCRGCHCRLLLLMICR